MRARVQKWGNSLALRIPKAFALEAGLDENAIVELAIKDGKVTIESITEPEFTLEELVAGINEDNLHGEISTGGPMGNEVW